MNYYLIAPAQSFHNTDSLLTYESEQKLEIGQVVTIPLGKKSTLGIVMQKCDKPSFETKPIQNILYEEPLPPKLTKALSWLADYYRAPMSSVIQAALPRGITKKRRDKTENLPEVEKITDNTLNSAQKQAIAEIEANTSRTTLLHGITGSGKTNVYIELAKHTLEKNQSVILLVPEIALTSQLVRNFRAHFDNIFLLHSELSESLRHQIWERILKAKEPSIIIGPRSALFAPIHKLGLIIIDEAHEPSYTQEQNPKYSALRLAPQLAKTILGSATPLVQDYYICKAHKAIAELNELAVQNDKTSEIKLIDLKARQFFTRSRILSNQLLESIQNSLDNHTQTMLFHNRRGTAPLTVCDKCGWQALCTNCYLPLVLHADKYQMSCHTCGRNYPVPTSCPKCQNASIHHKGFGTKLLEQEVTKLFPKARIARFDADTENDKQLNKIYNQVYNGEFDIIIGTQMIAKGFDFPLLTTLGVVQADAGLSLPDFTSEERCFQLITQVIGRAKRGHQDSKIFIQSFQPENEIIEFAIHNDYADLYNYLIQKRQKTAFPPYSFLLKLSMTYKTETAAVRNIRTLYKKIVQICDSLEIDPKQIIVSPPMPGFHERSNTGYTWQIILKAKKRQALLDIFDQLPNSPYLHYAFDPISLL